MWGGPFNMYSSNSRSAISFRDRQHRLLKGGVTASLSGSARMRFRIWARIWFCLLAIAPSSSTSLFLAVAVGASAAGTDTLTPGGASVLSPSSYGVFRSGFYWLEDVDGNQQFNQPPDQAFAFGGVAGDIPITGDWNGDGRTKVGVYRPSNGLFILDTNGNQQFDAGDAVYNLGVGTQAGDRPVVGDWNGNGRTKVGLFRQGFFWILDYNGNGVFEQGIDKTYVFGGVAGDVPVVGDWTGTGTSKIGLFRQGFYWILDANGNGSLDNINGAGGDLAFAYGGIAGDVPVVGDWNGSGTSKVGVFRQGFFWVLDANGNHQLDGTGPGQDLAFAFGGISGDVPVVGKWSSAIITATSGTPQTTQINTAFAAPLAVTLTNLGGSPLAGVQVTFSAPTSGASGTFAGGATTATALTNASGVATAPAFTANGTSGSFGVTASAPRVGAPATFSLTNLTVNTPVTVSLTPSSVSLLPSQNQTFTAKVSGTSNTGVTWSLSPLVGSITAAGLYTAPASITSSQTITVKATSVADPTKSVTAIVSLNPPVTISVTPTSSALIASKTQQFSATVGGSSNTAVTWTLSPAAGSISATGLYTAPATISAAQTVTVKATSSADATKSASATVTLSLSPPSITTVSPIPGTLTGAVYSQTLAASGTTPITWAVTGGILPSGLSLGSTTGILSGTPTAAGVFTPTITATNAIGSNSRQLSLTVNTALEITAVGLPSGQTAVPYSGKILASGGAPPYAWFMVSGTLPAGLVLEASTGTITGTPTPSRVFYL